jgi:DNA-binding NtrC family response regulator
LSTQDTSRHRIEGGGRTILVLDDDESILASVGKILRLYDFEVLEARDAHEALDTLDTFPGPIHLVMCDLVLPGLGGREVANTLLARRPGLRVLYTSGYSTHGSFRHQLEVSGAPFLGKPFEVPELLEAIEKALA